MDREGRWVRKRDGERKENSARRGVKGGSMNDR